MEDTTSYMPTHTTSRGVRYTYLFSPAYRYSQPHAASQWSITMASLGAMSAVEASNLNPQLANLLYLEDLCCSHSHLLRWRELTSKRRRICDVAVLCKSRKGASARAGRCGPYLVMLVTRLTDDITSFLSVLHVHPLLWVRYIYTITSKMSAIHPPTCALSTRGLASVVWHPDADIVWTSHSLFCFLIKRCILDC